MYLSGKRWSTGLCGVGLQFLTFAIQFIDTTCSFRVTRTSV